MRVLITGISGAIGAKLAAALADSNHELHAISRAPELVAPGTRATIHRADALSGEGLDRALEGVDLVYYLIHSMAATPSEAFVLHDRIAAQHFADAAARAGVHRIVYLGGLLGADAPRSAHLRSRAEVERILLDAVPASVALRSSIVIGARSRSFRCLTALVERLPALVLPPWQRFRTQPIDERDAVAYLIAASTARQTSGRTLDIAGPETVSYGELLGRIASQLMVWRPSLRIPFAASELASAVVARVSGEPRGLVEPLMGSLTADLLADDAQARALLRVRLHTLDAALDHALAEWDQAATLRAR